MCMFTGPVTSVSSTKIFARAGKGDDQFLVYQMSFEADQSVAMVLPLPVKSGSGEKAVKFINLKDYPDFFVDVESGFPLPPITSHGDRSENIALSAGVLEVVQVGNFEASFVPTMKDFSRLDARFRLPDNAWKVLPGYKDFGFAVFKLETRKAECASNGIFIPATRGDAVLSDSSSSRWQDPHEGAFRSYALRTTVQRQRIHFSWVDRIYQPRHKFCEKRQDPGNRGTAPALL